MNPCQVPKTWQKSPKKMQSTSVSSLVATVLYANYVHAYVSCRSTVGDCYRNVDKWCKKYGGVNTRWQRLIFTDQTWMTDFSVPGEQAADGWTYPSDQASNMLRVQLVTQKVNRCIGPPHQCDRVGADATSGISDDWFAIMKVFSGSVLVFWELNKFLAWSTLGNV